MAETYPYPSQEHYEFPRTSIDQAQEELRLYADPFDFKQNLLVLTEIYAKTPFMAAMHSYASLAGNLRTNDNEATSGGYADFNGDFYDGTVLATHINLAPAPVRLKREILSRNFLLNLDHNPQKETIINGITEFLDGWAGGGKNNWHQFLEDQDPGYRDAAFELAAQLFAGKSDSEERELDFLIGFTFASNLIWQDAQSARQFAGV